MQLSGTTVITASDGSFSYSVQLPPNTFGTASAQTTDMWGLNSATVYDGL
jgi:hypothetical protein